MTTLTLQIPTRAYGSKREYDRQFSRKYRLFHPAWKKFDNERNYELQKELTLEYYYAHKDRARAGNIVQQAIKKGLLKRGLCEINNRECSRRIDGHHEDYSQPLKVNWLCHRHHKRYEGDRGAGVVANVREFVLKAKNYAR